MLVSTYNSGFTVTMEAIGCSETTVATYKTKRCYNPEHQNRHQLIKFTNIQLHFCVNA
jgi:hypothetical protein